MPAVYTISLSPQKHIWRKGKKGRRTLQITNILSIAFPIPESVHAADCTQEDGGEDKECQHGVFRDLFD